MGNVSSILKSLSCDSCAKYVFNSAKLESECCDGCWSFNIQTDPIELQNEKSDEEIICDSCCSVKHKH
jgi:hypothetical protein